MFNDRGPNRGKTPDRSHIRTNFIHLHRPQKRDAKDIEKAECKWRQEERKRLLGENGVCMGQETADARNNSCSW